MIETKTKIATALLQAQKTAEAVGKSSRNTFAKFNYASAESMIAECREALHGAGLSLIGHDQEAITLETGEPILRASYILLHESGESMRIRRDLPIVVGKGRPMDKALLGAATETLGYLIRDLLLVPRQETDVSGRDDTERRSKPKPAPKVERRPDDVTKALGWIADAEGDQTALDECAKMIREMGLEGAGRSEVLKAYKAASK